MSPNESDRIITAYKTEHKKLLGYIRKKVPASYEAEDILQDVFYQLTIGFRDIERIENLTAWLYKVTNNRIIDLFRKKKLQQVSYDENMGADDDGPITLKEILPTLGTSPDEEELKEMIWEMIEETLNEMPKAQREVFIAHEFEQKSFKEISKKTGIGVNTLITRKRYAVLALRAKLENLYKLFKT